MPEGEDLDFFGPGSVVKIVADTVEMEASHAVETLFSDAGLRRDQLEAAAQLSAKEARRCGAMGVPPGGSFANLPLGVGNDAEPQAQS